MTHVFGAPAGTLAAVLVAILGVVLGAVAVLALRNRIFLRLGVRNVRRRPARSALIIVGSMLGTTIIAAALTTGDTMSVTIRSIATSSLGRTDEVVAAKGVDAALSFDAGATGARYFPTGDAARIARAIAPSKLVAGVAPVIWEPIAVQDVTSRQNEPRVVLFATGRPLLGSFGDIHSGGKVVTLADLRPGEVYLNAKAADKLDAHAGDTIRVLAGGTVATGRVRAIVRYDGGGTAGAGLLMPLAAAQHLLGKPGLVKAVFIANRNGVADTDAVIRALRPALSPLGLEADNTRQDALKSADQLGAAFMAMFTTFGSFSIAAGILLIFLIFVMLAAERRRELGIARAIGTRRGHLVQMFLYEGIAYDVVAALVGALLGVLVAYAMVLAMASAFSATEGDITITYAVRPISVAIAYSIGVLLTLAVVAYSAWRVSRMNIVTAIRDLADPAREDRRRRRLVPGFVCLALGGLLAEQGAGGKNAIVLGFGVMLLIVGLVPLARALGAPDRAVFSAAGLALVAWFVLPIERWFFGDMKMDFSIFVLSGLAIVLGATWTIMYNADLLLSGLSSSLGRNRRLAPVLKMSIAYPLQSRFRTGVTLAMFTLVVFTLVTGAITTGSFVNAFDNIGTFGGGFDVRATTAPTSPVRNMRAALSHVPGIRASDFRVVSSQSVLPVKAHQVGTPGGAESYLVHGADRAFLDNTTYGLAAMARGYGSAASVWHALATHRDLAVVDPLPVPRKTNFNFGATTKFKLQGFYIEDRTFAPLAVDVRDPQTGKHVRLTVIGVLSDTSPILMGGLWTSQASLAPVFGARVVPTVHLFALAPGVDPAVTAKHLESAFLANGMQADSLRKLLADGVASSLTFDRLIEGFMGLGLIVGVAALGVISARSVVERRQHIGVLRAIGVRRSMVQLSFLLEASFVALTSIVVGTALGLAVGYNVIADSRRQPSWANLGFDVPWLTLAVIFLAVYGVAMATTLVPARRASRVYPAEALRYQ